jgi:broad specificity phosphatase PhoE
MGNPLNYRDPFVCLVRHGETKLTAALRYNGLSDVELTEKGETQAKCLVEPLRTNWGLVLCSPLVRARRTAELAGFTDPEIVSALREYDYGDFEGKTTEEIQNQQPDWDLWRDGCPNGETPEGVAQRLSPIIERIVTANKPTLVFSHSHCIRIFAACWLGLSANSAAMFEYSPAHISVVGKHRHRPVILLWNDGSHLPSG